MPSRRRNEPTFAVPPVTIQVCPPIKGLMNHSYRDFSHVPAPTGYQPPTAIADMTFSQKVHDMLSQPDHYGEYIAWMPHGRAFKVLQPHLFELHVCPVYFGHKRYSSFLRSLNNFGFKHLSRGVDRNCYYHEFMLRGKFHLCQYMPPRRDARRLIANPDNEPDFYRISQQRPLELPVPQQQEQHHHHQQQQHQQQQDRSTASVASSNDCSVAESSLSNSEHGSYHNHGWPMHNVPTACASSMSLDSSIPQGLARLLQLPTLPTPLVPTSTTTSPSQMELVVQLLQSHLGQQQQQPATSQVNVLTAAIAKALVGQQQQQQRPPPAPPTATTSPEQLILCTVALHLLSSKIMPTTPLPLTVVSDKNHNTTLATVVWLLQQLLSSSHPSN